MNGYEIRECLAADEPAVLALHNRAFGSEWNAARWRWRFLHNPLGRTDVLGAFHADGSCAAVYGGVTLTCDIDGRRGLAMNHSDVGIEPELRQSLGGSRVLVELTRRFFERSRALVEIVWGFPEPGLLRTANRYAGVQVIRDVIMLVRDRNDVPPSTASVEVVPLDRFGDEVDELWRRCSPSFPTALRRDAAYLSWRFTDHPDVDYAAYGARDRGTGELRGIAIVRDGG